MKNVKLSSFIFILIALFLLADFIGYRLLYKQIVENHEKDTKLLFYQLQTETSALLTELFIRYEQQKEKLLQKHRSVATYLESHDLNTSLNEIYAFINEKEKKPLYNIYIANDKLVITNTTYTKDLGFDLSFAKDIFDRQYEENITGVSTPIRENKGERFFSYTSEYLTRNGKQKAALLQVSYTYDNLGRELKAIEEIIKQNTFLKSAYAFCYGNEDFVYEFLFMDPSYHRSSSELIAIKQRAGKLLKIMQDNQIVEKCHVQNGIHYKEIYMLATIPLSSKFRIIYTITFDESVLYKKLFWLNLIMLMLAILGVISILFIAKIRRKEQRLSEQDSFVQSAMHEMKTPLSIITLNNELRAMEYGSDSYTKEIDSAVKTLRNSYETISFI
ncbi:MAG: hypothetical protein L3J47_10355, partial [Sulfurovum sp.]|nr:hypothetical protein [Sulfurovum sp.]